MTETQLSREEYSRYHRHLIMPEFNLAAQLKLKKANVLVIGAGGLGAPILQYLAAVGVGHIGIVDFDSVEKSNLQRQVLFSENDIGKMKAEVAGDKIRQQNRHIKVTTILEKLTSANALEILKPYDVVIDGTDNFPSRYLINDACVLLEKVLVYGSIFRFEGQVSVFNFKEEIGTRSCNYRDLYPEPPKPGLIPNCADAGVLGVLPGIIGSLQANEAIKVITGIGEPLINKLFIFDALSFSNHLVRIKKNPENPLSGENPTIKSLIDYNAFCGLDPTGFVPDIKKINQTEFEEWKRSNIDFQLIDVREKEEYELFNINGLLLPLGQIENLVDQIEREKKVVVHCQSGIRSRIAIEKLQKEFGFSNLYNLEGGISGMDED